MSSNDFLRAKAEGRKLSMVTCYDYTFARLLAASAIDGILVGDSAAMVESLRVFALVLECVPATLARDITGELRIPTIGIGAGVECDGQILVLQDLLGLNPDFRPKFARPFLSGARCVQDAVGRFDQ